MLGKVNSTIVVRVAPPDGELQEMSEDPAVHDLAEVRAFREDLLDEMRRAVDAWRGQQPRPDPPINQPTFVVDEPPAADFGVVTRLERVLGND